MSQTTINVREATQSLVNALHALCPSRNYLSQYLLMIPREYPTVYDLFPEFLSDVGIREDLRNALKLDYGYQVNPTSDGLAYHLRSFLAKLFDLMEMPEVRDSLCSLLGVTDEALFNPRLEWIKAKLGGVKSEEKDGPAVIKILQVLSMTEEPYAFWRSVEDLRAKLRRTDDEVERVLALCQHLYFIQREDKGGKLGYTLAPELRKYIHIVKEIIES